MKPTEKYIKWLQAHPAVWEALQEEWEPQTGDWVTLTHKGERELNCLGTMDDSMDWAAWVKDSLDYRIILWLPTLGQLRRLLLEADSGTIQTTDYGDRIVMHCKKEFGMGDEPEIATTALWAKVRVVEEGKDANRNIS